MRIIDVDAHLHEPLDWLIRTDPNLAAELGRPARFMEIAGQLFGGGGHALQGLPESQRPKDPWDKILPGFVNHLQITDDRQPENHTDKDVHAYFEANARLRFCDERGIESQFLNPTFLVGSFVQAATVQKTHLIQSIKAAWNTWSGEQVRGHTDRLFPVAQIDIHDVPWSIAEMRRSRDLGSQAFAIPESPVKGRGSALPRSITHPDFEPIWSIAEELGMAAFAHVGFAREGINPGWANNGADSVRTFSLLQSIAASHTGTQLMLAAMIFDGLFERHPKLVVVTEEVGIDWLPHLVSSLDFTIGRAPAVLDDGHFRPSNLTMGETYTLPLAPVEYLQRQVRVSPLPNAQPILPVLDQVPPELLCFSSDYPHVEGSEDAVAVFERQLVGQPERIRREFFGGVGELMGV